MFTRHRLICLMGLACLTLTTSPAFAGTVYENGPIYGHTDAWTINYGFVVSDSFTISTGNSTLNGLSFGMWLLPGDTLTSVEVWMSSDVQGGTTYFDAVVNFTASNCFVNEYGYNVCQETGSFSGPTLNNGTYWLNLENAVSVDGNPVYWDENGGVGCHSPGCPSRATLGGLDLAGGEGSVPSEAFSLLGNGATTTGSTPEPSSLLLLTSGILGVAGVLRRKFL